MKLYNSGITIEIPEAEIEPYLRAGYVKVEEEVKPKPKATPKLKSIKKIVSTPKSTKERK